MDIPNQDEQEVIVSSSRGCTTLEGLSASLGLLDIEEKSTDKPEKKISNKPQCDYKPCFRPRTCFTGEEGSFFGNNDDQMLNSVISPYVTRTNHNASYLPPSWLQEQNRSVSRNNFFRESELSNNQLLGSFSPLSSIEIPSPLNYPSLTGLQPCVTDDLEENQMLGEKVSTLHDLINPLGLTDEATVLLDACDYIRYLHNQVEMLYTWHHYHHKNDVQGATGEMRNDLTQRGLCLVPVSFTLEKDLEPPIE